MQRTSYLARSRIIYWWNHLIWKFLSIPIVTYIYLSDIRAVIRACIITSRRCLTRWCLQMCSTCSPAPWLTMFWWFFFTPNRTLRNTAWWQVSIKDWQIERNFSWKSLAPWISRVLLGVLRQKQFPTNWWGRGAGSGNEGSHTPPRWNFVTVRAFNFLPDVVVIHDSVLRPRQS